MVTAKFKLYGIFAIIFGIVLCLIIVFIIYVLFFTYFLNGHLIKRGTLKSYQVLIFIGFFALILFYFFKSLVLAAMNVKIDTNAQTIFFRKIITGQTKVYLFSDFDGYLDTQAFNYKTGASYKVIYFVKEKKAEKILTGFYYSNMEEMQEAIKPIKYLGFQKNFSSLARRTFLNKEIFQQ